MSYKKSTGKNRVPRRHPAPNPILAPKWRCWFSMKSQCNNNMIVGRSIVFASQTYVQDLMLKEAKIIYELVAVERGHFYVCGDCKMAENVYQTLKSIIQEQTGMNSTQSDNFMMGLRVRVRLYISAVLHHAVVLANLWGSPGPAGNRIIFFRFVSERSAVLFRFCFFHASQYRYPCNIIPWARRVGTKIA